MECLLDCRLNEEMIETLFMVNSSTANPKDGVRRHIIPEVNKENVVLDPKKSQNIAILLRALNVTVEEVCDALLEGENMFMCFPLEGIENPYYDGLTDLSIFLISFLIDCSKSC